MKRQRTADKTPKAFTAIKDELVALGWRVSISPEPMLRGLGLAEWIFRLSTDRLDMLFVCEDDLTWSRKRFLREPFGDFTNTCTPKGAGVGRESLIKGAQSVAV